MRYPKLAAVSALGYSLLLASCGGTDNDIEGDLQIDRSGGGLVARFAPADGIIPFPSNLLFSSTTDGTLNIPVADANDFSDPQVALNALDGFSTIAPIKTEFNLAIEAASLSAQTVHLYEVTLSSIPGGAVTGVVRELNYGTEFTASVSPVDPESKTVVITPLAPLKAKTHYMVALTRGIQSTDGRLVSAEATYVIAKRTTALVDGGGVSQVATLTDAEAAALEPVRQLTNAQETALAGQGISSDSVVLSWTFTTQSISDVLSTVRSNASGTPSISPTSIGDTTTFLGTTTSAVNFYAGTLDIPYYLTNATVPTDPLNKFWQGAGNTNLTQFNSTPVATGTETIPLLLSVPKTGIAPWPVVIFQHGITSDRTAMMAIADSLASVGFAAVAIDMPLHGLAPGHPLKTSIERTFDLDLVNNTSGAAGPDGTADSSGQHYINLTNLVVTRDNVRQSTADLFALYNALATMDFDGGGADFDTDNVYFIGHSLGAMVGIPFLALEPGVKDAVFGMPGSGIAKLLDGSATFGPTIAAGLANAAGVIKGSADFETFMAAAQTLVDSGDPGNYASDAATGRGILQFEVIGDGDSSLPDQVIPNNVLADAPAGTVPAPLSGTDPLATLLGLSNVSFSTSSTEDQLAQIRFTAGDHRSLLDPTASSLATTVMQTATATFLSTNGLTVYISDNSVVEQ